MGSIYKNELTNFTLQVEEHGPIFAIVERDFMGEQPQVIGKYISCEEAQDKLDKLADKRGWKYCGRQEDAAV